MEKNCRFFIRKKMILKKIMEQFFFGKNIVCLTRSESAYSVGKVLTRMEKYYFSDRVRFN